MVKTWPDLNGPSGFPSLGDEWTGYELNHTQVVAFFFASRMNFIYGKNLRGFSHEKSKNDLEFFFPSTFEISTAWEVVILYERPLRRSSRRRSSEITMTPLSVSKESWKYTWYPETTIFYMDGWWQQQFFNVMIWNHPVETTIKKRVVWSSR